MPEPTKEIAELFKEASELKEVARKSKEELEKYDEASKKFRIAGEMSLEFAKSNDLSTELIIQAEVFGEYYLFESHECASTAAYERHDISLSRENHNHGMKHLSRAIELVGESLDAVSSECKQHLERNRRVWLYYKHVNELEFYVIEARELWDSGELIRALDFYRLVIEKSPKLIEDASDPALDPVYKRIALGNFFGMQVNAAQVLALLCLQKAEGQVLPLDLGVPLLRQLFEAYSIGLTAFDNNPEWDYYRTESNRVLAFIKQFLEDNRRGWLSFYIAFEDQPKFLAMMKEVDMEEFKEVETLRHMRESKSVKLWKIGGFWLLLFVVVFGAIFLLAKQSGAWWQLLLSIVGIEIILLIIGALTLRTIGDLSEEGFLKLISLALQQQFKFLSSKSSSPTEATTDDSKST